MIQKLARSVNIYREEENAKRERRGRIIEQTKKWKGCGLKDQGSKRGKDEDERKIMRQRWLQKERKRVKK